MFDQLAGRLQEALKSVRGRGKLTEANIEDALRDVRRALLEADVNYKVARDFVERVRSRAVGEQVLRSVTPGQQVIRVVHEELTSLLGGRAEPFRVVSASPMVVMVVGLQGSGKTTFAAKLANYLKVRGRRPMLVAADTYRPAAQEQLAILAAQVGVPVHSGGKSSDPVGICKSALDAARGQGCDVAVLDTAGRLHIDDEMMSELERIQGATKPHEVLLVLDSMTGQDAVNVASEFAGRPGFGGAVLTKLDGDTRGGAAVSLTAVTGKPIRFACIGERPEAIEVFHPDRMASRILGMGDVLTLVERAQEVSDEEKAARLEEKLRKQTFTLEDFLDQLATLKRMGPLDQVVGMIPGMNSVAKAAIDESALKRTEAIINSMTREERRHPHVVDGGRRKRIALGSGTKVQDVNRLLKQFGMMKRMMKDVAKSGKRGGFPAFTRLAH